MSGTDLPGRPLGHKPAGQSKRAVSAASVSGRSDGHGSGTHRTVVRPLPASAGLL